MSQKQKYVVILLCIVVVVVAVEILLKTKQRHSDRFQVVDIDLGKLPPNMPTDLPWENGVQIIGNHQVVDSETGIHRSDRSYITSKTMQQNLDIYKKYLKDNNWNISTTTDQADYKVLVAKKGNTQLEINLNYHFGPGNNIVTVFYSY
jgi:hypothetical protein